MTLLARWGPDNFIGLTGAPIPGLAVEIRLPGTTTKASLFTTSAGTAAAANPVTADDIGNASFYVASGLYDFYANGRTLSGVPVWPHPDDLKALVNRSTGRYNVFDFGAKGDWNGTTGTDDTAAFNACETYARAHGGGEVYAPSRRPDGAQARYRIAGLVHLQVGDGTAPLDLVGDGYFATGFFLDGAGAEIRISDLGPGVTVGLYGSTTGGFSVTLLNGATKGLTIGLSAGRTFRDIFIKGGGSGGVGTGLTIDGLQNSHFYNITCDGLDIGKLLDNQTAGNHFYNYEGSHSRIDLKLTRSSASAVYGPELNEWHGGHCEFNPARLETHLHVGAGFFNKWRGMTFAASKTGVGVHTPLVRVRDDGYGVGQVMLDTCTLVGWPDGGGAPHGTGIDVSVPGFVGPLVYTLGCQFQTLDCSWKVADGNQIAEIAPSWHNSASVTQRFRNQSGGTQPEDALVIGALGHSRITTRLGRAAAVVFESGIDGETYPRIQILADGTWYLGSGAAPPDIAVYRIGARRLHTDMQFEAEALSSNLVSGVPTDASFGSAPRDGTIVLSTNGNIYGRVGGVWKGATLT